MRSMQKCCLNVNLSVWLSISAIEGCGRASGSNRSSNVSNGNGSGSSKCVEGKFHLQISCCHLINEMWAVASHTQHTHTYAHDTHTHTQTESQIYVDRQMQRCSNRYWQHFSHAETERESERKKGKWGKHSDRQFDRHASHVKETRQKDSSSSSSSSKSSVALS